MIHDSRSLTIRTPRLGNWGHLGAWMRDPKSRTVTTLSRPRTLDRKSDIARYRSRSGRKTRETLSPLRPSPLLDAARVQAVEQHDQARPGPAARRRRQRRQSPHELSEEARLVVDHDVDREFMPVVLPRRTVGISGSRRDVRQSRDTAARDVEPQRRPVVILLADPEFEREVVQNVEQVRQ